MCTLSSPKYRLSLLLISIFSVTGCITSPNSPFEFNEWKYQDDACDDQVSTQEQDRVYVDTATRSRIQSRLERSPIYFVFNEGNPYDIKVFDFYLYNNEEQGKLVELQQHTIRDSYFYLQIDRNENLIKNYVCSAFRSN